MDLDRNIKAHTESVQAYFTRSATTFDSLYAEREMGSLERAINRHFRRDIYERFVMTMEHVHSFKADSVLDVGCGSGRYLESLHQLGVKRLVGIDFSPTMIDLARRRLTSLQPVRGGHDLIEADFMTYDSKEQFDVVIALGVLDYVRDPAAFLQKLALTAKHSVVASFPSTSIYRTPIRKARYRLKRCPVYFYTRDQIAQLASTSDFSRSEIVKIRGAGQDYFVSLFK